MIMAVKGEVNINVNSMMGTASKTPSPKGIMDVFSNVGGLGDMSGLISKVSLIGTGITTIVGILKIISGRIDQMIGRLAQSDKTFKGTKDLIDKMWNMALRPISQIMVNEKGI